MGVPEAATGAAARGDATTGAVAPSRGYPCGMKIAALVRLVGERHNARSTREIGRVLGVSGVSVHRLLTGKTHGDAETWLAIARALGMHPGDVFLAGMAEAEADDEARAVWLQLAGMVGNALASERPGSLPAPSSVADVTGHYAHSRGTLRLSVRRRLRLGWCESTSRAGIRSRGPSAGRLAALGDRR